MNDQPSTLNIVLSVGTISILEVLFDLLRTVFNISLIAESLGIPKIHDFISPLLALLPSFNLGFLGEIISIITNVLKPITEWPGNVPFMNGFRDVLALFCLVLMSLFFGIFFTNNVLMRIRSTIKHRWPLSSENARFRSMFQDYIISTILSLGYYCMQFICAMCGALFMIVIPVIDGKNFFFDFILVQLAYDVILIYVFVFMLMIFGGMYKPFGKFIRDSMHKCTPRHLNNCENPLPILIVVLIVSFFVPFLGVIFCVVHGSLTIYKGGGIRFIVSSFLATFGIWNESTVECNDILDCAKKYGDGEKPHEQIVTLRSKALSLVWLIIPGGAIVVKICEYSSNPVLWYLDDCGLVVRPKKTRAILYMLHMSRCIFMLVLVFFPNLAIAWVLVGTVVASSVVNSVIGVMEVREKSLLDSAV